MNIVPVAGQNSPLNYLFTDHQHTAILFITDIGAEDID